MTRSMMSFGAMYVLSRWRAIVGLPAESKESPLVQGPGKFATIIKVDIVYMYIHVEYFVICLPSGLFVYLVIFIDPNTQLRSMCGPGYQRKAEQEYVFLRGS